MKIYRTTAYYAGSDETDWVRYGTTKIRYAAAKGASVAGSRWMPKRRVTLEVIEFADTAWVMIEDTHGDPSA